MQRTPESVVDLSMSRPCDSIYYSEQNSLKDRCRILFDNAFLQAAQSLQLPGVININVPNLSVLDYIHLNIVLPQVGSVTDFSLCEAWGYGLINYVQYRLGNSQQYQFSGQQLFLYLASLTETDSKFLQICDEGGLAIAGSGASGITPEANLIIPLPFVRNNAMAGDYLPFDLSLCNSPAVINVSLNPLSSICGGSNGATYAGANRMSVCNFQARLGRFEDHAMGLKNNLLADPKALYVHNCIMLANSFQQPVQGTVTYAQPNASVPVAGSPQTITLTGFRWGALNSLILGFYDAAANTASTSTNAFVFQRVRNVTLYYNGQLLYQAPNASNELFSTEQHISSGAAYPFRTVTSSAVSSNSQIYYLEIPLSQYMSTMPGVGASHMQFGEQVGQNVMTLTFTPVITPGGATTSTNFIVYGAWVYEAGIVCQADRTEFIF